MTAASFLKKYFFISEEQTTDGLSIPYNKVIRLMKRYAIYFKNNFCECENEHSIYEKYQNYCFKCKKDIK